MYDSAQKQSRHVISLGITNFQNGDTANTLLKRVDAALYEAKRGGRNRVVVNGEDPGISQQDDRAHAEWPQHQARQGTH